MLVRKEARSALVSLCENYWYPLYARRGYPPDQAQDLTQEFFIRVLEGRYLNRAHSEKGRFRSFLLSSFEILCGRRRRPPSHAQARWRSTRPARILFRLLAGSGRGRAFFRWKPHDTLISARGDRNCSASTALPLELVWDPSHRVFNTNSLTYRFQLAHTMKLLHIAARSRQKLSASAGPYRSRTDQAIRLLARVSESALLRARPSTRWAAARKPRLTLSTSQNPSSKRSSAPAWVTRTVRSKHLIG